MRLLKYFILAVVVFVIGRQIMIGYNGTGSAVLSPEYNARWFACENNEECVVFPHTTCFPQTAVNALYRDDYLKYVNASEGSMMCTGGLEDDSKAVAQCENKGCALKIPVKPAVAKH